MELGLHRLRQMLLLRLLLENRLATTRGGHGVLPLIWDLHHGRLLGDRGGHIGLLCRRLELRGSVVVTLAWRRVNVGPLLVGQTELQGWENTLSFTWSL